MSNALISWDWAASPGIRRGKLILSMESATTPKRRFSSMRSAAAATIRSSHTCCKCNGADAAPSQNSALAVRIASRRAASERRRVVSKLVVSGSLTFSKLTKWIAFRKAQPPRRFGSPDGCETIHVEIAPYASGETTVEAAYRAMKQARKTTNAIS